MAGIFSGMSDLARPRGGGCFFARRGGLAGAASPPPRRGREVARWGATARRVLYGPVSILVSNLYHATPDVVSGDLLFCHLLTGHLHALISPVEGPLIRITLI